jgi:hypothetical protein
MRRSTPDYEVRGRVRIWGLPVMRLFCRVEQQALAASASQAPQVSLTVIHYHSGAHLHVEPGADATAILQLAAELRTDVRDYPPVDP